MADFAGSPAVPVPVPPSSEEPAAEAASTGIETTEDEREAYLIVKSILRDIIEPRRLALRDQPHRSHQGDDEVDLLATVS